MTQIQQEKKDITIAKGLGILLVVIGHILARGRPEYNDWFVELTRLIYVFHMPFFMVLSGYVFFRVGRIEKLNEAYGAHVKKQTIRLLLPFFAMGIFVLVGKMLAAPYLHVDNKPEGLGSGLYNLFWNTDESPSFFIWYIFVLYVYAVLAPLAFRFLPHALFTCLGIGCILYVLPAPDVLYLSKLMPYFLFFIIGGLLRTYDELYLEFVDRYQLVWGSLFLASFAFFIFNLLPYPYTQLICGLLSVPVLHGLCRFLMEKKSVVTNTFYMLGQNTLAIYLFNTICIGLTKAVLFLLISWHGMNFLLFLPILVAAGVLGPLIIQYIWRKRHLVTSRVSS